MVCHVVSHKGRNEKVTVVIPCMPSQCEAVAAFFASLLQFFWQEFPVQKWVVLSLINEEVRGMVQSGQQVGSVVG